MKIVLPVAGKGTRLLPHSNQTPKPLFSLVGKTILDHLMENLVNLNVSEFVFITGYLADQIEEHVRQYYSQYPITFIRQNEQKGLGHAIYCAKEVFVQDEEMLVILGDQVFTMDWEKLLGSGFNCISLVKVKEPSNFGVVTTDEEGFVLDMEEKPKHPRSNLAISGTYYFSSAYQVFESIERQMNFGVKKNNEIQITDAMKAMLLEGKKFYSFLIEDWNDCGNHKDLLLANQTLLNRIVPKISVSGENEVISPSWISEGSTLQDCRIGPNVSIGKSVHLEKVTLENTIVCDNTTIKNSNIKDSYIGADLNLENLQGKELYLS